MLYASVILYDSKVKRVIIVVVVVLPVPQMLSSHSTSVSVFCSPHTAVPSSALCVHRSYEPHSTPNKYSPRTKAPLKTEINLV